MGALARITAALIGTPLDLPSALLTRWPELSRARWRRGGLPPRIAGWLLGQRQVAAVTLWHGVWMGEGVPLDPALLLHELRHVEQFATVRGFPARYVWESLRRGYRANHFELDADRWSATRLTAAGAGGHSDSAPTSSRDDFTT